MTSIMPLILSSSHTRRPPRKPRQDMSVPATALNNPEAIPRKCLERPFLEPSIIVNHDSDNEDAALVRASFQQRRLGDTTKAESSKSELTEFFTTLSKLVCPVQSQSQVNKGAVDDNSSSLPRPKRKRHNPKACNRCDNCIMQRRRCNGQKPVCGRCTGLGKVCEWHEGPISRTKLEELKRDKSSNVVVAKPKIRLYDRLSGRYNNEGKQARGRSQNRGEQLVKSRIRSTKPDIQNESSEEAREHILRPARQQLGSVNEDCPIIVDAKAIPEQDVDCWTYNDHLDMLGTLSEARTDPFTNKQLFGHKKGDKIFDNTTKALEDFDKLEDLDEGVPRMQRHGDLKLNWDDSDASIQLAVPNVTMRTGEPWLASSMWERVGLRPYQVPRLELTSCAGPKTKGEDAAEDAS